MTMLKPEENDGYLKSGETIMAVRTQKVRLYPNNEMKKVLDELCDYRRYCWNKGLETWNDLYESSLILGYKSLLPDEYKIRNELKPIKTTGNTNCRRDAFGLPFLTWETLGKISSIKRCPIGANPDSSPRKHPDRVSKLTEPKSLTASYDWTSRERHLMFGRIFQLKA